MGNRLPSHVHHISYANFGHEPDTDLMALCEPCHWLIESGKGNQFWVRGANTTPLKATSLASVLAIVTESIRPEHRLGMNVAEEIYKRCGLPADHDRLIRAIQTIITESVERKVRYPTIVFMRLRQLQRHEWAPDPKSVQAC
jgi:hypothetical protein